MNVDDVGDRDKTLDVSGAVDDQLRQKGRQTLLSLFNAYLAINAYLFYILESADRYERLLPLILRVGIAAFLCNKLYAGRRWAWYVVTVMTGCGFVVTAMTFLKDPMFEMGALALFYAFTLYSLTLSRSVRSFLSAIRN